MAPEALELDLQLAGEVGRYAGAQPDVDPLRLELPALPIALSSAAAVRTTGALWFDAQLEAAGVIRCAEWLVDRRATLPLGPQDRAAAEAYAARRDSWVAPSARNQLAGRLFAIGPASGAGSGSAALFVPALAALASALVRVGRDGGLPLVLDPALVRAALGLAGVIGAVADESLAPSASAFTDQLRWSISLLERRGVCALVGARGFWDAVGRLQGEHAPDLRRLLDQARHGQTMIRWLADSLPVLQHDPPATPDVPGTVVAASAAWIRSCGLPVPQGAPVAIPAMSLPVGEGSR